MATTVMIEKRHELFVRVQAPQHPGEYVNTEGEIRGKKGDDECHKVQTIISH